MAAFVFVGGTVQSSCVHCCVHVCEMFHESGPVCVANVISFEACLVGEISPERGLIYVEVCRQTYTLSQHQA